MSKTTNYYIILGVDSKADEEVIRKAYRSLAMQCHPDRHPDSNGASDSFKQISEAYQVLSDKEKRSAYDAKHPDPKTLPANPQFGREYHSHPEFPAPDPSEYTWVFPNPRKTHMSPESSQPNTSTPINPDLLQELFGSARQSKSGAPDSATMFEQFLPQKQRWADPLSPSHDILGDALNTSSLPTSDRSRTPDPSRTSFESSMWSSHRRQATTGSDIRRK